MANRQRGKDNGNVDEQERAKEAARQARIEAREKEDKDLEAALQREKAANKAVAKAKKEAKAAREAQAAQEAQAQAQAAQEAKEKRDAEAKAEREAEEARAIKEAEAKAEAQAKREAEEAARAKAEEAARAKAKRDADAKAEAQAKREADAKAKAQVEAAKKASDLRKQKEAAEREQDEKAKREQAEKAEIEQQAKSKVVDPDKTESKRMNRSPSGERLANETKAQMEEEEEEEEDVEASSIAKKPKKAKKAKKPRAKNPDDDRTETERVIKEANMKRANGNLKLAKRFEEIDAEQKAIADKLTFFSAAGNEAPEKNIPRKETKRGARKRIAKEAKNAAENPEADPNQKGRKLPDFIVKEKAAIPKPNNDARKPPRQGSKIEKFRKQKEQRQAMEVHAHRNNGQFHRNVQNNNSYFEKRVKRGLLFKPTAFQLMIKKIIHTLKRSKPEFNHINHVESTVTASMQTMTENYLTEFLDDTMKVSKHCRPTTRDKTWILLKKDIEHLYRFRNNGNPFSNHEPEAEMEAREDRKLKRH
jgi:hypothetical protein